MKIICAVDFSPPSDAAAQLAASLGAHFKDDVVLLHAMEVVIPPGMGESGVVVQDFVQAQRKAAEAALVELAQRTAPSGVMASTLVQEGPPAHVVATAASPADVRCVVLASHGRGAVERVLLGSVADRVVRTSPKPVVVAGNNADAVVKALTGKRALQVVAGVDLSPASSAAMRWLREVRKLVPMDVTMVHGYWPPGEAARLGLHGAMDLYEVDPDVVAVLERDLSTHVGDCGGTVRWDIAPSLGRPADRVMERARDLQADVVLMGTGVPHGLRRVLPGSNALQLLHAWHGTAWVVPVTWGADLPRSQPLPDFSSFLAVTDFSPQGNAALMAAVSLARVRGGTLHVLHAVEEASPHAWSMERGPPPATPDKEHPRNRLLALLAGQPAHVSAHVHVLGGEDPATVILQASDRLGVHMVVAGHHGKGAAVDAVMGSVAQRVLARSSRPVLLVR